MGAKIDEFQNYLSDINKNFLSVKEDKLTITHLWVDGIGWENTILIEEDFKNLDRLNTGDEIILIGTQKESYVSQILKGYYN